MEYLAEVVCGILRDIIERRGDSLDSFTPEEDTPLYERPNGFGLDSLETAELSVLLEQRFGHDPYSTGKNVQTFGELIAYYKGKGS